MCSLECLGERENRVGIDQVKDGVEKSIKKEVDNIRKYQTRWVNVWDQRIGNFFIEMMYL